MKVNLHPHQKYTITVDDEPLYLEYLRPYKEKYAFKNLFNGDMVLLDEFDLSLLNKRDNTLSNDIFTVQSDILECVISRQEILEEHNNFNKNAVFINVYTPGQEPVDLKNYFHDQLSVSFYDITIETGEKVVGSVQPISNEVAKKIKDFILKHKDKKFAINCDAGISRSAGVAMAVECLVKYDGNKYYYSTSSSELKDHPRYKANLYVYEKIVEA